MFCPQCGKQAEDGAVFCGGCGAPLRRPDQGAQAAGAVTPASESVLSQAATPVAAAAPAPQGAQPTPGTAPQSGFTPAPQRAASMPLKPAPKKTLGRGARIGIGVGGVCVVAAAIVGLLFLVGVLPPGTAINEENFPNPVLRQAVSTQLDTDGNGKLTTEEASKVVALAYNGSDLRFGLEGANFDAATIRDEMGDNPENARGGATLGDLSLFPNLVTVDARNAGLSYFDAASVPQLQKADLRTNEIGALDLSKNAELSVLLCEAETSPAGLGENGLYYDNLITSIKADSSDNGITVNYDNEGRPVSYRQYRQTNTIEYDNLGRVIHIGEGPDKTFSDFSYGANGLLSRAYVVTAMSPDGSGTTYLYGYDADGKLAQLTSKYEDGDYGFRGVFEYEGNRPLTWKAEESRYKSTAHGTSNISWNESGVMEGILNNSVDTSDDDYTQSFTLHELGENGVVTGITSYASTQNNSLPDMQTDLTFSDEGAPKQAKVQMFSNGTSNTSVTLDFQCNADGYITSFKSAWGSSSSSTSTTTISYIKMVGSLEDRPNRRFVPQMRMSLLRTGITSLGSFDDAFHNYDYSRGDWSPYEEYLVEPQEMLAESMGFTINYLANANQRSLAAYDAEHWTDGLTLGTAQPVDDAQLNENLLEIAAYEVPASPLAFAQDPVYGPIVAQYAAFSDEVGSYSKRTSFLQNHNLDSLKSKYPLIEEDVWGKIHSDFFYSDRQNFGFCYVDLDQDGTQELAVTMTSGYGGCFLLALYGNNDGVPITLAQSRGHREGYSITTDGHINYSASGGFDVHSQIIYELRDGALVPIAQLSYEPQSYDSRGNSDSPYNVTYQRPGEEAKTEVLPMEQLNVLNDQTVGSYEFGTLPWTGAVSIEA